MNLDDTSKIPKFELLSLSSVQNQFLLQQILKLLCDLSQQNFHLKY